MNKLSFAFLVLSISLEVTGQVMLPDVADNGLSSQPKSTKVDYTFSTGTSFFSSPGFAKGSTFYIAPEFKFNLSPKFKVEAGIMLMQNRVNYSRSSNLFAEKSVVLRSAPAYEGLFYASGTYALNPKLTFSGSVMKDFSPGNNNYQGIGGQNSFQAMSMGVNYKLSEHITLGGGIRVLQSNGYNPYTGYNYGTYENGFDPFSPITGLGN